MDVTPSQRHSKSQGKLSIFLSGVQPIGKYTGIHDKNFFTNSELQDHSYHHLSLQPNK